VIANVTVFGRLNHILATDSRSRGTQSLSVDAIFLLAKQIVCVIPKQTPEVCRVVIFVRARPINAK